MWPGRSVPLEKATEAYAVHQADLLAWHSAKLEETSCWPWNESRAAQKLDFNRVSFVPQVPLLRSLWKSLKF